MRLSWQLGLVWRQPFGVQGLAMRTLEKENVRLKKIAAELELDRLILKDSQDRRFAATLWLFFIWNILSLRVFCSERGEYMIQMFNVFAALATIIFGTIGWMAPRYTMEQLDLTTAGSKLGLSEIRAASGALFIGLGAGALLISHPFAFIMVGCAYAGAALGRATSILLDGSGSITSYTFLAVEVALAVLLITLNMSAERPA